MLSVLAGLNPIVRPDENAIAENFTDFSKKFKKMLGLLLIRWVRIALYNALADEPSFELSCYCLL